ncbi:MULTISPECIES: hypothetical protein [unclassified Streptomyces]|uniref:hypothetical protein n=1 Tax=unclassified Streptomyces TaxID=2593676 RepID=UPI000DBA1D5A|nr:MULTISPECIES: hypothetical protein [unclassified Streptomyces]MYT69765.1 hypothetical protein [Streptomyces sp. SID8367]
MGQGADTAGVGGKGHVEFTPDTVVYDANTSFGSAEHGLFAVVVYQSASRSEGRVVTTADKGGLRWRAPDGHTVRARNTQAASKLAPIGFSEGGSVFTSQVFHQDAAVFDITPKERGGTLIYVDGTDTPHRWKIPAHNAGVSVPALKFALN